MARNSFEVIEELRDDEGMGIVASITKQEFKNGYQIVSWTLFKEYEPKPGAETRRTNFLNERHIDAVISLLHKVRERLRIEKDRTFEAKRNEVPNV